jgi:LysM repeat protein
MVVPVKIATPDKDGKIIHKVQPGQSFWAIAVAYKITIKDIETWNNISKESKLQVGQELFIPGEHTKGYATPTPQGMVMASTPGPDGKIIHAVQSHQTLSTIATAYKIQVETILALNGLQVDWPLQIGQTLLIHAGNVTPSPTPRPLTPVEKLTPASDGTYYHVIRSGETLSWIADLYEVSMNDLMAWNGLNAASILQPDQKLVLQVTPPATITPTPDPATATPTATTAAPTHTLAPTIPGDTPEVTATVGSAAAAPPDRSTIIWSILGGLGALGIFMIAFFSRKR